MKTLVENLKLEQAIIKLESEVKHYPVVDEDTTSFLLLQAFKEFVAVKAIAAMSEPERGEAIDKESTYMYRDCLNRLKNLFGEGKFGELVEASHKRKA